MLSVKGMICMHGNLLVSSRAAQRKAAAEMLFDVTAWQTTAFQESIIIFYVSRSSVYSMFPLDLETTSNLPFRLMM